MSRTGLLSFIAALFGLISMFLPWVLFSASRFPSSVGESPAQLLSDFLSPPPQTGSVDPAVIAWEIRSVLGVGLWLIGSVVFAVGLPIAAVGIFARVRWAWAGFVMLIGSTFAGSGIASFSTTFTSSFTGVQYTVGPDYGLAVAIGASLLAVLPLVLKEARPAPSAGAPQGMVLPPHGEYSLAYGPRQPSSPTPQTPEAVMTPSIPQAQVPTNRFCPICGRWYPADHMFCGRDGTALKPVQ